MGENVVEGYKYHRVMGIIPPEETNDFSERIRTSATYEMQDGKILTRGLRTFVGFLDINEDNYSTFSLVDGHKDELRAHHVLIIDMLERAFESHKP